MEQFAYLMSEISRLRIENAEMRKNLMVRENRMKGEPTHYRSKSVLSDQEPGEDQDVQSMFSDNKGFEQFAEPDYGSNTRAEKAGFMGHDEACRHDEMERIEKEEHKKAQRRLHRFSNYPIGIGNKYF